MAMTAEQKIALSLDFVDAIQHVLVTGAAMVKAMADDRSKDTDLMTYLTASRLIHDAILECLETLDAPPMTGMPKRPMF